MLKPTIEDEVLLWRMRDNHATGTQPCISEDYLMQLLGVSRPMLREMYENFLKRHNVTTVDEAWSKQLQAKMQKTRLRRA